MNNLRKKKTIITWLVVFSFVVVVCLIGCSPTSLPQEAENNEVQLATTGAPVNGPDSEIYGVVFSKSDVTGLPDIPLPDVLVLAIAVDNVDTILKESGTPVTGANQLTRLSSLALSEDLFDKYVEDSNLTSQNGEYSLAVLGREYFLCIANIGSVENVPVNINGCVDILVENDRVNQNLFWGEAGVTAQ